MPVFKPWPWRNKYGCEECGAQLRGSELSWYAWGSGFESWDLKQKHRQIIHEQTEDDEVLLGWEALGYIFIFPHICLSLILFLIFQ